MTIRHIVVIVVALLIVFLISAISGSAGAGIPEQALEISAPSQEFLTEGYAAGR